MTSTTDRKEINKLVIKALKEYRALKVQNENRNERHIEGISDLFTSVRRSEQQREIRVKQSVVKVKQVERALSLLDNIEQEIINLKFLSSVKQTDMFIYEEIGITREMYYEKKREALANLATALDID